MLKSILRQYDNAFNYVGVLKFFFNNLKLDDVMLRMRSVYYIYYNYYLLYIYYNYYNWTMSEMNTSKLIEESHLIIYGQPTVNIQVWLWNDFGIYTYPPTPNEHKAYEHWIKKR